MKIWFYFTFIAALFINMFLLFCGLIQGVISIYILLFCLFLFEMCDTYV